MKSLAYHKIKKNREKRTEFFIIFLTVIFSILPFVDAENPICYCNTSPRTGALNFYIFFYTVPGHLPEQVENALFDIGDQGNGCNTAAFVNFLQDFCTSFYRKVSPTSPSTNPLEL